MSFNLANKPGDARSSIEEQKSRLYEMWQANLSRSKIEAGRIFGEKAKRKGKWDEWMRAQLSTLSPPEYASMVRSELKRLAK
ncbi:hypothetical protein [Pseudomonas sp. 2FG]|uniref:hypothetical protein n=1 Tax=Pseudomonas sp. 2FG TaxID=2502191 RepID=UPI0010F9BD96|nr:hypothetical protein [Pseudomonas sp. 2FG]